MGRRIVVIGAGITGLAAARELTRRGVEVTVVEAAPAPGGALRRRPLAGALDVDVGAEAFLDRVPEARALAADLGLDVVAPATTQAALSIGGRLVALPRRTLLGTPSSLAGLRAVLGAPGTARVAADLTARRRPEPLVGDPSVGEAVATRLGRTVVTRLIDPLLGGVYAGRADALSLRATVPGLVAPLEAGGSLLRAVGAALPAPTPGDPPAVFATVASGMGRLALAAAEGLDLRTGQPATGLARTPQGWAVTVGGEVLIADGVLLAVPAAGARRLLAPLVGAAAAEFTSLPAASIALLTAAFPRRGVPRGLTGSGLLVPPDQGLVTKAATFLSAKWAHVAAAAPELFVVRVSAGRAGDTAALHRDDDELAGVLLAELRALTGLAGRPVGVEVTRWDGALAQYLPGHLERVARLRAALPAGVAVAGAPYDGVGVPACIRSGQAQAAGLLAGVGGTITS